MTRAGLPTSLKNVAHSLRHQTQRPAVAATLVAMVCALHLFVWLGRFQFADYDLFARLAVGRLWFTLGSIAHQDVFSFSPTKAIWYDHEWLSGVLYYLILHYGGSAALFFASALNMLATLALLLAALAAERKNEKHSLLPAVLLLFVIGLMSIGMWAAVLRAQLGSFLLFATLMWLLSPSGAAHRSRKRLLIPFVFLVWINFHGGCIVGYGLLGLTCLFALLERREGCLQLAAIGIVSVLVLFLNPYGVGYLGFLFEAIGKERPMIDEWGGLPLNPLTIIGRGYGGFLPFALLVPLLSLTHRRKLRKEGIAFTLCALWYGANHVRLLPFFYMAAAVYYAPAYLALLQRIPEALRLATRVVLSTLAALYIPLACWNTWTLATHIASHSLRLQGYPVEAMQWIRCNYQSGNILSSFNVGSYVLWQGYPEFLVAVDGRYEEVYEDEVVQNVLTAFSRRHPNRDAALLALSPDLVLLCGEERQRRMPQPWRQVFESGSCAVHARVEAQEQENCESAEPWVPHF